MKRTTFRESKAQRWRALAILDNGTEVLLCLGASMTQVKDFYQIPWYEYLPEDVRKEVDEISLQKWVGLPDCGEWITQASLPLLPYNRAVAS
jgi:hypothetical protein